MKHFGHAARVAPVGWLATCFAGGSFFTRMSTVFPFLVAASTTTSAPVPAFLGLLAVGGFFGAGVGFVAWLGKRMRRDTPPAALSQGIAKSPPPLPVAFPVTAPVPPRPKTVADLSWQEFELMIGELYRRQGYAIEMCSGDGPDGGVDLRLRLDGKTSLVQRKHWKVYKVGASTVREMFGVLTAEKADAAVIVTTGRFTRDARSFAAGKPLELIDGEALNQRLQDAKWSGGGDLLDVQSWAGAYARSATLTTPDCPFCRSPMTLRQGKASGRKFWGCSTYPRCSGKRNVRQELVDSSC